MSLPPYDQSIRELERQYQVVLPDSVGQAALGFRDGVWFRLNSGTPRPVLIRSAIILCPHAAGSIVQIVCWWMRENAHTSRALDLATELALCVGELARKAVEDDPLGMSLDNLSTSQQNAMVGFSSGIPQQAPAASSLRRQPAAGAGAGLGQTGGYESGSYGTGAYQASTDPYAPPTVPRAPREPRRPPCCRRSRATTATGCRRPRAARRSRRARGRARRRSRRQRRLPAAASGAAADQRPADAPAAGRPLSAGPRAAAAAAPDPASRPLRGRSSTAASQPQRPQSRGAVRIRAW
jgi:hypothetical protein